MIWTSYFTAAKWSELQGSEVFLYKKDAPELLPNFMK